MKNSASIEGYTIFASRGGMKILTPSNNRGYKPRFSYFKEEGLNIPEYWHFFPKSDRLKTKREKYAKGREKLMILETQDGRSFTEEELVECGLSPATLQKEEIGEDKPETSKRSKLAPSPKRKVRNKEK